MHRKKENAWNTHSRCTFFLFISMTFISSSREDSVCWVISLGDNSKLETIKMGNSLPKGKKIKSNTVLVERIILSTWTYFYQLIVLYNYKRFYQLFCFVFCSKIWPFYGPKMVVRKLTTLCANHFYFSDFQKSGNHFLVFLAC